MIGITFDLGRPAFVALDQQPQRIPAERHRRCIEQRLSRHDFFRLPDVRNDFFDWLPDLAATQTGEGNRRREQLQKPSPAQVVCRTRVLQPRSIGITMTVVNYPRLVLNRVHSPPWSLWLQTLTMTRRTHGQTAHVLDVVLADQPLSLC